MALTDKEMITYVNAHVEPDLAHVFDASEIDVNHPYQLVQQGYRTPGRFACIGGGVDEARRELREELNLTTAADADLADVGGAGRPQTRGEARLARKLAPS